MNAYNLILVSSGPALGTFLSMVLGGLLCRFGFGGGWPSVFYIFGGLGLTWCVLWIIFVSDEPSGNRWISTREKDYIKWSLKDAIKRAKRVRSCFWFVSLYRNRFKNVAFCRCTIVPSYMKKGCCYIGRCLVSQLHFILMTPGTMVFFFLGSFFR